VCLLLPLLLVDCTTVRHTPITREMPNWPRGAWVTLLNAKRQPSKTQGELLALTPDAMLLLTSPDSTVLEIRRTDVSEATIDFALTSNTVKGFDAWGTLLNVGTISHGFLLILTLPINLLVTIPTASSTRKPYHVHYPQNISWEETTKFARFPQGLPPGVKREQLR
jgi:hypothetical protein